MYDTFYKQFDRNEQFSPFEFHLVGFKIGA